MSAKTLLNKWFKRHGYESARTLLNKWLRRHGYEIVPLLIFKDALKKEYDEQKDFFFVQIGANDGIKFDDLFEFVTSHKCSGLVVEPLKCYFEKLVKNYERYPAITPVNLALHNEKKRATIYHVDPARLHEFPDWAEGIGSLDPNHYKTQEVPLPSDSIISEEVDCVHFMELIRNYHINKINLLQIDTEGYDAEIIKMIDFSVIKPSIIKYEWANLSKKDEAAVRRILKDTGYDVFKEQKDNIAILRP